MLGTRNDGNWGTVTLSVPNGLTRCKNRAEFGEGKLVFRWLYFRISGGFFARAQNDGNQKSSHKHRHLDRNVVEWRGLNRRNIKWRGLLRRNIKP